MLNFFNRLLGDKKWVLADGAMGTNLFSLWEDIAPGSPPEILNLSDPEKIISLHEMFLDSGSEIILTNSFGANSYRMSLHGFDKEKVAQINFYAAQVALNAVKNKSSRNSKILAGSVGPTGEFIEPLGTLKLDDAVRAFSEQIEALVKGGVDFIWGETFSDVDEAMALAKAAENLDVPFSICMSFDTAGYTMMGVSPERLVEIFSPSKYKKIVAIGANCGSGIGDLLTTVSQIKKCGPDIPIIAKSNAGIPEFSDGKIVYKYDIKDMDNYATSALNSGATIIGGCCGTTPDDIRMFYGRLSSLSK